MMFHQSPFSTFMDNVVNRRGANLFHNRGMKKGKWRHDRLADAMKARGMQENAELARFLKVNAQTTHKWLTGVTKRISGADLFWVADRFDVGARWLMDLADTPGKPVPMDPDEAALLALYRELRKAGQDWAEDWVSDGQRTLKKLGRDASSATPLVRKIRTI